MKYFDVVANARPAKWKQAMHHFAPARGQLVLERELVDLAGELWVKDALDSIFECELRVLSGRGSGGRGSGWGVTAWFHGGYVPQIGQPECLRCLSAYQNNVRKTAVKGWEAQNSGNVLAHAAGETNENPCRLPDFDKGAAGSSTLHSTRRIRFREVQKQRQKGAEKHIALLNKDKGQY
eukprot:TRINITY_DN30560_c0_g1_i2.p2 TRINITY_DN30560_c0_g1~~TRINITY_DN30560_c0_g1_i2.p2  ORF type:complete len:179 (-),score=5.81 TRINITY_DN30560_c0_g1_i2:400-936(-)